MFERATRNKLSCIKQVSTMYRSQYVSNENKYALTPNVCGLIDDQLINSFNCVLY